MGWNIEACRERLQKEWKRLQDAGITVSKLTREMNLANLSPTEVRTVHGCHLYCHAVNFAETLDDPLLSRDNFKRLHRYLHVLRVEQRRIMQSVFDGDKIQVQGPKFHGLLYKPYDDDSVLAWRAVLAGIALTLTTQVALAKVFPDYVVLIPSVGIALGDCAVANIGVRGERELISVGAAANYAAKILGVKYGLTIDSTLWGALEEDQQKLFIQKDAVYYINWSEIEDAEDLLSKNGFTWTIEDSVRRMEEVRDGLPLDDISSSEAQVQIDFATLGPKTMKVCEGASLFVDVDGYTKAIDNLLGDEERLCAAVQWLHLFRYEMRHLTTDRSAVPIQHQGDRLQALAHLPNDDETIARRRAVELCIDYNSSMEDILNADYPTLGKLHVAIGASSGKSVAIRSGVRGDLDASCLSKSISQAEHWQIDGAACEICISAKMFDSLEDEIVRGEFKFDRNRGCYAAKGLTWTRVADLRRAKEYETEKSVGFNTATSGIVFGIKTEAEKGTLPLRQTRPWAIDER
jgi:class 3 adenylate cyclase